MYRLIKAKEESWNFTEENRAVAATKVAASPGKEET
jgi:hypothetical protein